MTCLRGDFLEHALKVQRAALPASITTVRMLERERAWHLTDCTACAEAWLAEARAVFSKWKEIR